MRLRLFASLRDKVTSSAQSPVPLLVGPSQGSSLSILTEPHVGLHVLPERENGRQSMFDRAFRRSLCAVRRPPHRLHVRAAEGLRHRSPSSVKRQFNAPSISASARRNSLAKGPRPSRQVLWSPALPARSSSAAAVATPVAPTAWAAPLSLLAASGRSA